MDPVILGIVIPPVVGIFVLIGLKMRYSHMKDSRLSGTAQQEGEHLADTVDNLGAEVGLLRSEVLELNERVEFTERLLERPKTEE